MQIVIDIPEEEYNECKMQVGLMKQEGIIIESLNTALRIFVANGTPLPKGHGRLIDADVLMEKSVLVNTDEDCYLYVMADDIADAPTIIEADKEGAEE